MRANLGARVAMIQQAEGGPNPADPAVIGMEPEAQQARRLVALDGTDGRQMDRMIDPSKPYFGEEFTPETPPPAFGAGGPFSGRPPSPEPRRPGGRRMTDREVEAEKKFVKGRSPPPNYMGPLARSASEDFGGASAPRGNQPPPREYSYEAEGSPGTDTRVGGYFTEWSKEWKGLQGATMRNKVQRDIDRGVDFTDATQVPLDLLRSAVARGPIEGEGKRTKLPDALTDAYSKEIKFREETGLKAGWHGPTEGGGAPAHSAPALARDFQPPPETHSVDGRVSWYAMADAMSKAGKFNPTENPYDMRTWNDRVKHYNRRSDHPEAVTIGILAEKGADSNKMYKEYVKAKGINENEARKKYRHHLLRHADTGLLEAELKRKAVHGKLSYKQSTRTYPGKSNASKPQGYQPSAPHTTPRGLGDGHKRHATRQLPSANSGQIEKL